MIAGKRFVFGSVRFSDTVQSLWRVVFIAAALAAMMSLTGCKENFTGMLNPKGIIAYHERKLFFDTTALMLIVVLPVIVMSFTFIYHYQVSHRIREYEPNWSHSYFLESIWWGIPCAIITILAVLTWKKSHELDPYKSITGADSPPLIVQAIALPWKWLFIYPEQNIATVNYLEIPVNRQVEFWITTDNVAMSAFFVPQLGSQIYAMAGMRTRLHLLGNEVGTYVGMNTQYNGDGFSDMHFPVHVVTEDEMTQWVETTQKSDKQLTKDTYNNLLVPTVGNAPEFYTGVEPGLFDSVINLYMHTYGAIPPHSELAKYNKG